MEQSVRVISIRLPERIAVEIDKIATKEDRTFASALRQLLVKALGLK